LEAAIGAGLVVSSADLEAWLVGRLHTCGMVDSSFGAAAWALSDGEIGSSDRWERLAGGYWARTPSAALRRAGRAQGRGLLRAACSMWTSPALDLLQCAVTPVPLPLLYGAAGRAAGLSAGEVSTVVATASVSGPAWASTRLLGLDPYVVAGCLGRLGPVIDRVSAAAAEWADPECDHDDLPAVSAPLIEIGAERHATREVRLFAS
jgi:urease accessory protein